MKNLGLLLFTLFCVSVIGCAGLLKEETYVLIDNTVEEEILFSGAIYSLPMRANVRKIAIIGTGRIQNIEIQVRDEENRWEPMKRIKRSTPFPLEVRLIAETDAIKIIQRATNEIGRIKTVQFYTVDEKRPEI